VGEVLNYKIILYFFYSYSCVSGGKAACSSFIEKCFAFIGENAMDTVKTTAFCNLPKDALVKLISSDYLGLEEEDVWRAVLNWAKYQVHFFKTTLSFLKYSEFIY